MYEIWNTKYNECLLYTRTYGHLRWPSMKGCVPWIIINNNHLLWPNIYWLIFILLCMLQSLALLIPSRSMHNGGKVEENVLHPTNSFKRERWQLKSLVRKRSYKHFFSITLQMSFVFLLLFELQWLPFIGQLQVISKPGSSCEREEDLINGGVSSCLDGQIRQPGEGLEAINAYLWNISVPSIINVSNQCFFPLLDCPLEEPRRHRFR